MAFMGIALFVVLLPLLCLIGIGIFVIKIAAVIMLIGSIAGIIICMSVYCILKKKGKFSQEFYSVLSGMSYGKYRVFGMKFLHFALIALTVIFVITILLYISLPAMFSIPKSAEAVKISVLYIL